MPATIKIKNSSTTGAVPTSSDLVQGELAVNVTDLGLYTENASGTVVKLNAPSIDDKNTGATKHLTISTAGNLGLGVTPSGTWKLDISGYVKSAASAGGLYDAVYTGTTAGSTLGQLRFNGSGTGVTAESKILGGLSSGSITSSYLAFYTTNAGSQSQTMTLDASGNLLVGTTSGSGRLVVDSGTSSLMTTFNSTNANGGYLTLSTSSTVYGDIGTAFQAVGGSASDLAVNARGSRNLVFGTNNTERARIDSSGNLLVGTTTSSETSGVGFKLIASATMPSFANTVNTTNGGSGTYVLYNTNATNNGYRFYVGTDGGIRNFSGNNSNLSDARTKTNIDLAGDYLDKICKIPVKVFNYKDEADGEQRTLGVIAQDVEAFAPEFVNNEGFGETLEGEAPLKSIYATDMMFALMKCIQELKAEFDAYKASHP